MLDRILSNQIRTFLDIPRGDETLKPTIFKALIKNLGFPLENPLDNYARTTNNLKQE